MVLSILGTYINGLVLDHFIFGFNIKKRVCIISKKEEEIRDFILHNLKSGATIYEAIGAYDNQPRREIITIVDKTEYALLMNYVLKTDRDAFVTVYTAVSYTHLAASRRAIFIWRTSVQATSCSTRSLTAWCRTGAPLLSVQTWYPRTTYSVSSRRLSGSWRRRNPACSSGAVRIMCWREARIW